MEFAYQFVAKNAKSANVSGVIYAETSDIAYAKLQRSGYKPLSLKLSLSASLRNATSPNFNGRDLVRFYRTLGRRLMGSQSGSLVEGLRSAVTYVADAKLKQASLTMMQGILDGKREHEAMASAGFLPRDVMVVRAASSSGNVGHAFQSLSDDHMRANAMRSAMRSIWTMPIFLMLGLYGFAYFAITKILPQSAAFMKNMQLTDAIPKFALGIYSFTESFVAHKVIATFFYILVPVALVFLIRSQFFKALCDKFPLIREISIKSDHASLWSGYVLLYSAGISPVEAASILKDAANRPDSRLQMSRFEQLLQGGYPPDEAAERANMPRFVIDGMKAAAASNQIEATLGDMTNDLIEDVNVMTDQLKVTVQTLSTIMVAFTIMGFFFAVNYPMIAVAIKSVA